MEHTPAPWKVERTQTKRTEIVEVMAGNFDVICRVNRKNRVNHINRELPQEANARLIAAAPDLLAACKQCVTFLSNSDSWSDRHGILIKELKAAISKAEGK